MNDQLKNQLEARIQSFAADITAVLQGAVANAVEAALSDLKVKPAKQPSARSATRTRAPAEVNTAALLRELSRKPGQRMEELSKSLATSTKVLRAPMAALLDAKKVKKSGKARGTKYRAA
mgnify:FL=1